MFPPPPRHPRPWPPSGTLTEVQNTVAQYIATQPILDLCERSARRLGAWVYRRWWKHAGLYLEGAKKRAEEESKIEEAISKEEGMTLETTTGRELGRG